MTIHDYCTEGGKNLIKEYLHHLPRDEQLEGYRIRHNIINMELMLFLLSKQDNYMEKYGR